MPKRQSWLTEDRRRLNGVEITFGTTWAFDGEDEHHSIIWNPGSGELYTHRHRSDTVAVLGQFGAKADIDSILSGWEHHVDEPDGGHWACTHIAQDLLNRHPCYALAIHVDGTIAVSDQPATRCDIRIALGGVAITTAAESLPPGGRRLIDGAEMYIDRNAYRHRQPANAIATALWGAHTWPIRGDVVITASNPAEPLTPNVIGMLLHRSPVLTSQLTGRVAVGHRDITERSPAVPMPPASPSTPVHHSTGCTGSVDRDPSRPMSPTSCRSVEPSPESLSL